MQNDSQRISGKHLLTLERGISYQMIGEGMQFVIPRPLHATYKRAQQSWLRSFLDLVLERQAA